MLKVSLDSNAFIDKQIYKYIYKEQSICVLKYDSIFYAFDNKCPHKNAPLQNAKVENCKISCPWHGWTFELETGSLDINNNIKLKMYNVSIENDHILIDV